jgi:predicted transcriptional regulator
MTEQPVDSGKRATLRQFAALGAASGLSGLASGSDDSASAPRRAIAGYLSRTPGAHFSKLRDDLELGTGEAQHHLRELERAGTIESSRDGEYRRFFLADRFSAFEQRTLGHLRRETQRGMLVELLADPTATASDIATTLDVSRPAISTHAALLEESGLLDRTDGYRVRQPATVATLLVRYADSFGPHAQQFAAKADDVLAYDP